MSRITQLGGTVAGVFAIAIGWAGFGQAAPDAQTFALSDTKDLVLLNVKAEAVEYKGRKAVRLTKDAQKDGFALLRGTDFQDGTIEADIALKITTPPGVRMPGFVGIAFRARPDASRYELFYLRPGNSHAEDQANAESFGAIHFRAGLRLVQTAPRVAFGLRDLCGVANGDLGEGQDRGQGPLR